MTSRVLCVGGAVSYDYLICPMSLYDSDSRLTRSNEADNGPSQLVIRTGSADLVAQLLNAADRKWNYQVYGPALQHPPSNCLKHNASSVVELNPNHSSGEGAQGFEVSQVHEISKRPVWHSPPIEGVATSGTDTVVLTGSGKAFQDVEPALDFLQRAKPRYIVHYMGKPLAVGKLWDIIRNGPMVSRTPDPDSLAVIVDAEDLRSEGIPLSRSLSWEATAEDFVRNLGSNGRLDTLVTCPNLFVRFATQGVIHHRGRDAIDPKLYFNPREMENPSQMVRLKNLYLLRSLSILIIIQIGLDSAFTAGFALGFPNSDQGIRLGLAAAQKLSRTGFEQNSEDRRPDYPIHTVMEGLKPDKGFSVVSIPSTRISSGDSFSIFDNLTGNREEIARQIVSEGPDIALERCPVRQFGDLRSFDRTEQESLGSIVDTLHERLESNNITPTCVGILGPVGSGKKFIAKNLSAHVTEKWSIRTVTYNTRVMRIEDLINNCHTIRDNSAENCLTVTTFENVESVLEANNPLLSEFIEIMRDGAFNDRGHQRALGRCLLFFLVNQEVPALDTSPTPTATEFKYRRAVEDAALLDNLHGAIHLSGPNQANPQDKFFSIRRALMLRQLLRERHPHIEVNGKMRIDDAVLHALLFVPSYKHGLRSLEKIISTSRLSGRTKFDISALPPEEQIQLHVDGRTFMSFLRSPKLPPSLREKLAEGLFETYKKQRQLMATTEEEKKALASDRSMQDWDELPGELKESTRAQADDIPRKLRAVGYFMLNEERSDPFIHVPEFTSEDLDLLAEMEHERFNAERLQRQWRMGPRNSKQRTTPFIIPWRDLTQEWRDVDRVMVECVPRVLDEAGYRIYRMKSSE